MANSTAAAASAAASYSKTNMGEHPNTIPNPHHRKIDLQSHTDLTYLQRNLALAAREKLDIYFPQVVPTAKVPKSATPATIISLDGPQDRLSKSTETNTQIQGDETADVDPLRGPVTELLDAFLRETYTSAAHSIAVNGIDASALPSSQFPTASNPRPDAKGDSEALSPDQEVEGIHYTYAPFDRRLQKRMQALYEEVESLTAQVASLRREAPKSAAQSYISALESALSKDEEMWDLEQKRLEDEKPTGLSLETMRHDWNQDIRNVYNQGVNDLAILNGIAGESANTRGVAGLTETVGKLERARNVAAELE